MANYQIKVQIDKTEIARMNPELVLKSGKGFYEGYNMRYDHRIIGFYRMTFLKVMSQYFPDAEPELLEQVYTVMENVLGICKTFNFEDVS